MKKTTPWQLALRIILYYLALLTAITAVTIAFPQAGEILPMGGGRQFSLTGIAPDMPGANDTHRVLLPSQLTAALIIVTYMVGSVFAALPVSWVYMGTKQDTGYKHHFVQTLIVLPICATTAVLGIKDSLALAFGLAALVAAVRFRVRLRDSLDGVYVLTAVTIGLLTGIGYLAAALVMTFFFSMVNLGLWSLQYGRPPSGKADIDPSAPVGNDNSPTG